LPHFSKHWISKKSGGKVKIDCRADSAKRRRIIAAGATALFGFCLAGCAIEVPIGAFYETERKRLQRIILNNMERIFGKQVDLEDIAISTSREATFNSEGVRQFCIKPTRGSNGLVDPTSTYVVHVRGEQIVHSQPALVEHGCEEETYAPLAG
jgi:hypothetical protein